MVLREHPRVRFSHDRSPPRGAVWAFGSVLDQEVVLPLAPVPFETSPFIIVEHGDLGLAAPAIKELH
jgi:hypothetical protein